MNAPSPVVGNWYRLKIGRTGAELFEVVAIDDNDATIEVQHFDGTLGEMDFDSWEEQWEESLLESAQAPEDWTGSVDVEPEDIEQHITDAGADRQWASPLDYLDDQRS